MFLLWKVGLLPDEILIRGGGKNDLQTNLPPWSLTLINLNQPQDWVIFYGVILSSVTTTGSFFPLAKKKNQSFNNPYFNVYFLKQFNFCYRILFDVDERIHGALLLIFLFFKCSVLMRFNIMCCVNMHSATQVKKHISGLCTLKEAQQRIFFTILHRAAGDLK